VLSREPTSRSCSGSSRVFIGGREVAVASKRLSGGATTTAGFELGAR
jgi:hypothetical protein